MLQKVQVPADYTDQILKVRRTLSYYERSTPLDQSHIYDMDQAMCRFDMPQNQTVNECEGRTIQIKMKA